MKTNDILKKGIQVVVFLFAAFGGFLKNIAPPEASSAPFAVGFSAFGALAVLLFISASARNGLSDRQRKAWLAVAGTVFGVAIIAGFLYRLTYLELTFPFPPDAPTARYTGGIRMLPKARDYMVKNGLDKGQLVDDYGGLRNIHLIWTERSAEQAELLLLGEYVVFVLALAITIFCLTEGLMKKPEPAQSPDKSSLPP